MKLVPGGAALTGFAAVIAFLLKQLAHETLPAFAIEKLRRLKRDQAERLLALGVRQSDDTLVCAREDGERIVVRSRRRAGLQS